MSDTILSPYDLPTPSLLIAKSDSLRHLPL